MSETTTVPLSVADVDDADVARVAAVLRSGWLASGACNDDLEERFAARMGVRHAVSLNSCASALHLAMLALGVHGEVILPSFTFVATANAVVTAGATPVFVDIEPRTRNLDPAAVRAAITPRTEAILPVHFAGQPCDMPALVEIARRHGLALIEDSAEAIGAEVAGRPTGSFGVGCFSFYPTKNMTTGEGGMLVTDDERVAETVRTYAGHGVPSSARSRSASRQPWQRSATLPGYNLRMSNIAAALGVGQLARLDELNARRRAHAAWYDEHLAHCHRLEPPVTVPGTTHVFQMYTVTVAGRERDAFVSELRRRGVGASVHFDPPVHRQPYYAALLASAPPALPATEQVAASICTLPLFPSMTEKQRAHVGRCVVDALCGTEAGVAQRA